MKVRRSYYRSSGRAPHTVVTIFVDMLKMSMSASLVMALSRLTSMVAQPNPRSKGQTSYQKINDVPALHICAYATLTIALMKY